MKKVFCIILTITLVLSFSSAAYAQIEKEDYYARSTLSGNELEFYDYVYQKISQGETTVYNDSYGVEDKQALKIIQFVWNDAPELINDNGYYTTSEAETLKEQIDIESKKILALLNDDMSEYEKVKTLYYYLGKNIEYDQRAADDITMGKESKEIEDTQSIVGGLINNNAVCAGIVRSLQYLLYQIDISCYTVSDATHSWSLIKIDGEWYYADLTTDMQKIKDGTLTRFLYDDSFIMNKELDEYNPELPKATSTKYLYGEPAESSPTASKEPNVFYGTHTSQPVAAAAPEPTATATPEPVEAETGQNYAVWFAIGAVAIAAVAIWLAKRKK